jgi:hypothetical protein
MLGSAMNEDPARIVNGAKNEKIQVNLIINNHAAGDALLSAEKIGYRLYYKEKQQGLF